MFSFSSFLGFLFHSCQSVPLGPNADSCSSSVPEGVWLKSGDPWGYMVFPELPKSTKLGKKTHSKLHTGFVPLAVAQLEKRHVTAPLTVLQCLNWAGGEAVPTQNLGKRHLEYVWLLICEMRRKKEQKKSLCLVSAWGTVCPLFIQTAALVLKETDGILFCAWGTIVLKQTSCTWVDTLYLGGCGTQQVCCRCGAVPQETGQGIIWCPQTRGWGSQTVPGWFPAPFTISAHLPAKGSAPFTLLYTTQHLRNSLPGFLFRSHHHHHHHLFLMGGISSAQRLNHWMMGRCWIWCKLLETAHVWGRNLIL